MTFFELHTQAQKFLSKLDESLDKNKIKIFSHWDIDHLCYRVETLESYEHLKKEFRLFSKLLIESEVNGRPIATYKLAQPVLFRDWEIDVIELPAPKASRPMNEGFEHIEIVCDLPFSELKQMYRSQKMNELGLKKAFNQELEIQLDEQNIKFHQLSLESVIRLEGNSQVWSTLQQLNILENLSTWMPLIAGTYPLGVETENSDIDILLQVGPHQEEMFLERVTKLFGRWEGFKIFREQVKDVPTILVCFKVNQIPFELFAQDKPPVEQTAYRHFLVEEKLLKYGGEKFREEVLKLRKEKIKTEPAFAQALHLLNDPYEALLELQRQSTPALIQSVRAKKVITSAQL